MKIKTNLYMITLKKSMDTALNIIRSGPMIFSLVLCIAAASAIISDGDSESIRDIRNYEAGKVADRDIIAEKTLSFIDEKATKALLDTAAKEIPAVFQFSNEAGSQMLDSWNSFCSFTDKLTGEAAARLAIDSEYPAYFSNEIMDAYLSTEGRAAFRVYGEEALNILLKLGIFSFNREEIKQFHPDIVELQDVQAAASEKSFISYDSIITIANVRENLAAIVRTMEAPFIFKAIAVDLIKPFVKENVFFSPEETQKLVEEAAGTSVPVMRSMEEGEKIIRKGFIITEDEMSELRALHQSYPKRDPRNIIGYILLVLILYSLFIILSGRIILGRELNNSERYLLAAIIGSYIIGALLLKNITPGIEGFPVSFLVPTSLFIMIIAVFLGTRTAMIMALALPFGAYYAGAFDYNSFLIAIVSGVAASTVLHNAQNRMSLIKAGLVIAAANIFAIIVVQLLRQAYFYDYPILIFWAALNGIVSGMLTLGFLPPLEHALNAVTPFRLIELSDLNAPILRKLFTAAPGTYSHSLMVANLAEQACQDIGANALLARVGAYYHDIGKMDNPDYFVENQTDHNRHDEIAPRLSATIIRSHVKLGVEKAISLGLPKDVIAIIGEHHGNSVISWFYNKAAEQEELVNSEDFSYPGNPPRSRESAVVMLADITEAAARTISKPTAGKIDKQIQQLFEDKVEHGQLAESELSFRDLEIIKKAFVKTLTGYYHSRIEYPKQKEEESKQ